MLGCFPYFGVLCSPWFPPCFNTPRLPVASNRRLRNLAAPRTGRIGHCLKKVAAADSGFPEVLCRFWGIPRWVGLPLRGSGWGFPEGLTFAACPMFAAVGSRPFDRRLEPLFSAWLGSLHSFCCARRDRIPRVLCDTLADESISSRQTDGELLVLMCLRHGTAEEGRQLGGEPALRFAQLLELSTRRTKWYQRTTSTAWWRRRRAGFPSLCPRGTWPTFGIAYGSSSWRLRTASSARTFPRWRMSGTARTN